MTERNVVTDTDDRGVVTITLNRPDVHNAFDEGLIDKLNTIFRDISFDDTVRAVVLTGAGSSFSAGADLNWMRRMADYSLEENVADAMVLGRMMLALKDIPVPTIARIQGPAIGGALGLICACDIAIASDNAFFRVSEVKLGLVPAVISPYVLAAIGDRQASRYFLTAEKINTEEAVRIGLIHQCVEPEQLDQVIEDVLAALADNGPDAVVECKKMIAALTGLPLDERLVYETATRIANIRASDEGKEGVSAFLNKRRPDWIKTKED